MVAKRRVLCLWGVGVLGLVAAVLTVIFPMMFAGRGIADQLPQPPQTAVGALVRHGSIGELRRITCLTDNDLAAMGCTQDVAERLLAVLVEWHDANIQSLESTKRAESDGRRMMGQLIRGIGQGAKDGLAATRMEQLRSAIRSSASDRHRILRSLMSAVEGQVPEQQKSIWNAARANGGLPSPYCYLSGVKASQRSSLQRAMAERHGTLAAAGRAEAAGLAEAAFVAAESQILSAAEQNALATVRANLRQSMPGVLAASRKVLGTPQ